MLAEGGLNRILNMTQVTLTVLSHNGVHAIIAHANPHTHINAQKTHVYTPMHENTHLCSSVSFAYVDAVYWFYSFFFIVSCSFLMLNWLFQHDCFDTYCFLVSYMHAFCIFVFAPVQRN